jgi:hypothetical protein
MLKENRVVVLARVETTYGVDAVQAAIAANGADPVNNPHPYSTDALLCAELDVSNDLSVLERGNYNPSLSSESTGVGRVLGRMAFRTELRASGVLGTPPRIGRLFRACGMAETIVSAGAASQIGTPVAVAGSTSAGMAAFVAGLAKTTPPNQCFDTYRLTVTTGGAAAAAMALVTSPGFSEYDGAVLDAPSHSAVTNSLLGSVAVGGTLVAPTFTFTGTFAINEFIEIFFGGIRFYYQVVNGDTNASIATAMAALIGADARLTGVAAAGVITGGLRGTAPPKAMNAAITLGASGAVVTPNAWAGNVVAGEACEITLRRNGVRYDPISDNVPSLTLWAFLDGALYRLLGARGTWSTTGEAAQYPTVTWTFTGIYQDPIDQVLPSTQLAYETSKPYKVELAQLALYGLGQTLAKASRFSMDFANTVEAKDNINASEAYDEVQITARQPVAGCDPEAYKPSVYNPWARMRREDTTKFHVAIGIRGGVGNIVRLRADRASLTNVPFANRNNIRAYDHQMRLARVSSAGDDELYVHFG